MTEPSTKQQQLDVLADEITRSGICQDLARQATQLVFGDGNPDAAVVLIGEAPGKQEDMQGKPFVGAAGKLLNEMLHSIGFSREDVYITNIVKYRPPENRDPLPEEKAAFWPYLQTQLGIIQPKLIVTLGRHSMNCFLPDLQISKVHGQPKRIRARMSRWNVGDERRHTGQANSQPPTSNFQTLVILPLYHPAAAIYNRDLRQTLLSDFAKIPEVLDQLETTP